MRCSILIVILPLAIRMHFCFLSVVAGAERRWIVSVCRTHLIGDRLKSHWCLGLGLRVLGLAHSFVARSLWVVFAFNYNWLSHGFRCVLSQFARLDGLLFIFANLPSSDGQLSRDWPIGFLPWPRLPLCYYHSVDIYHAAFWLRAQAHLHRSFSGAGLWFNDRVFYWWLIGQSLPRFNWPSPSSSSSVDRSANIFRIRSLGGSQVRCSSSVSSHSKRLHIPYTRLKNGSVLINNMKHQ